MNINIHGVYMDAQNERRRTQWQPVDGLTHRTVEVLQPSRQLVFDIQGVGVAAIKSARGTTLSHGAASIHPSSLHADHNSHSISRLTFNILTHTVADKS